VDRGITEPLFPEIGDENRASNQRDGHDEWNRQFGVLGRWDSAFQKTSHQPVNQWRRQDFNFVDVSRVESMTFLQSLGGLDRSVGQPPTGKRLVADLFHPPDVAQVGQGFCNVVLAFKESEVAIPAFQHLRGPLDSSGRQ